MNEEAIKNADPESRMQMRVITLETALQEQSRQFFDKFASLENRVEILEAARERQIVLNSKFDNAIIHIERNKEPKTEKKGWFW